MLIGFAVPAGFVIFLLAVTLFVKAIPLLFALVFVFLEWVQTSAGKAIIGSIVVWFDIFLVCYAAWYWGGPLVRLIKENRELRKRRQHG